MTGERWQEVKAVFESALAVGFGQAERVPGEPPLR